MRSTRIAGLAAALAVAALAQAAPAQPFTASPADLRRRRRIDAAEPVPAMAYPAKQRAQWKSETRGRRR